MIAVGLALILFGGVMSIPLTPSPYRWEWRDLVVTLPIDIGVFLVVIGTVKWLWLVAP